jgi:hypothetical protein
VAEWRKAYEYWFDIDALEVISPDGQPVEPQFPSEAAGDVLQLGTFLEILFAD